MGVGKILFSYLIFDFEVDAICVLILSSLCFVKSSIVGEISEYNHYILMAD